VPQPINTNGPKPADPLGGVPRWLAWLPAVAAAVLITALSVGQPQSDRSATNGNPSGDPGRPVAVATTGKQLATTASPNQSSPSPAAEVSSLSS
jgi:hypothetical protein